MPNGPSAARNMSCITWPATHRVGISNHRIVDVTDTRVTFRWKEYKRCKRRTMRLTQEEFLRRFLAEHFRYRSTVIRK